MKVVAILGSMAALALSSPVPASPPAAGDRSALERLLAANDAAWNAGDPAALSRLYTADGTARLGYAGRPVTGREGLRLFFQLALSSAPGTRHVTRLDAVEMIGPDTALIDAEVALERTGKDGQWQAVQSLRSNLVAVRHGDRWWVRSIRAHPQPLSSAGPR